MSKDMKKLLSVILSLFVAVCVFSLCGCESEHQKFTHTSFDYFDTVTSIVGFEKDEKAFKENCKKIEEQLEAYHRLYTIYSRINGINNLTVLNEVDNGAHRKLEVDQKIIDLLLFSKEMHSLTGGKVNVAMGSVLSIWHDYRTQGLNDPANAELPPLVQLKNAQKHTDIDGVVIDSRDKTVFLSDPEARLDVGAIAKGYAVEQTALWMKNEGITGYLLNVGGNIRTVGKRADGEKWQVGIENPDRTSSQAYVEYLELEEMSLVVSGSYQRFYVVEGKNYHHIINPETLMPATGFKSVSVLCKSSAKADAMSTALFCMSFEEGLRLVESQEDTYALWVTDNGEKLYSKGFKEFTKEEKQ